MTSHSAPTFAAICRGACLLLLAAVPALALAAATKSSTPAQSGSTTQSGTPAQSGSPRDVPIPDKIPAPVGKDSAAPTVTIRSTGNGDVVEEYREGGRIYMVHVTPKHGRPYYLYDDDGNGRLDRTDADKASVSPVYWTIYTWD